MTSALLAAAVILAASTPQQRVQPIEIDGRAACADCRIQLDRLVTLGKASDPVVISGSVGVGMVAPARDSRGRFFAAANGGTLVAVYDSTGRVTGAIDGRGTGSNSFRTVTSLSAGPGDTLFIGSGPRVIVMSPTLQHVRTFELPQRHTLAGVAAGGTLVSSVSTSAEDKTLPVAAFRPDVSGRLGFGSADSLPIGNCASCESRNVQFNAAPAVWVSKRNVYEAESWSLNGQLVQAFRVMGSPWFETWNAPPSDPNPLTAKPRTVVVGASGADSNRVWVVASGPPADWKPWSGPPSRGIRVVGSRTVMQPELIAPEEYDYLEKNMAAIVELIDLPSRKVLATTRFEQSRLTSMGGDLVFTVVPIVGGANVVDIYRLRLVTP